MRHVTKNGKLVKKSWQIAVIHQICQSFSLQSFLLNDNYEIFKNKIISNENFSDYGTSEI